ncbi:enoyl-CoA hydratase-related protein, partial [Bordetella pertussis]|uniref:enoyl-CoA hydratase-related protein n=1 Tax=Bordetella pertussis TaxID=520 RepID=UPI0018A779DA
MNTPDLAYTHWRLHREADGLAWLALARADAAANSLSAEVMAELAAVLDALQAQPPKGLVILSGKENGFIVGADINEFGALQTPQQARELVARGWQLFNRLAATPYPTLARRLPALIGAPAALDMMLTGRRVDARRAAT